MTRRSYTSAGRKADEANPLSGFSFELDDVVFECEGSISLMDLSEFVRLANAGVDSESKEGMAIIAELYLSLLGSAGYQRFRRHVREHNTEPEMLLDIIGGLTQEATSRPTERSSDSSDGPPDAPATAKVVSFSRATVEKVPLPETEETPQAVSYG